MGDEIWRNSRINSHKYKTDIQTRNDLCVTQNPYGEFDLTGIYTETQSKGGRNVLQNWVTHPVNNIQKNPFSLAI